jgi:hypothetical protein
VVTYRVPLTPQDLGRLNAVSPKSDGSGPIGRRAEEIVKIHFRRKHPRCVLSKPSSGADLKVVLSKSSEPLFIEIKGTASVDMAWQQLKVSSRHSWQSLTEKGIPVYRVCGVFSAMPTIQVLTHGVDFVLQQEDRWTVKRVRASGTLKTVGQPSSSGAHIPRSKYDALRRHLEMQKAREITVGFKDVAQILGFTLPASAYKYPAFWANQADTARRPWARAWQDAGYAVDGYHLAEADGWVRFRRQAR